MPLDFSETLVVGISSSALFDLRDADRVFQEKGIRAYREHMVGTEDEALEPGTGFALVQALLNLNTFKKAGPPLVEVLVMSRNSPETGVRIMNAVRSHGLAISRFAFTGGEPLSVYAEAFGLDLFLSTSDRDVQDVVDRGICASAILYPPPEGYEPPTEQVRVAFDGDAVLFSEESEIMFKEEGLSAFHAAEDAASAVPMKEGPFAQFLRKLAKIKEGMPDGVEYAPVRIAVITARNAPAATRVITTLRSWGVYVDEAFFLGGLSKGKVVQAFRAHIFFDDQEIHVLPASNLVPSGRVPYRTGSILHPDGATAVVKVDATVVALTRSPADVPSDAGGAPAESPRLDL